MTDFVKQILYIEAIEPCQFKCSFSQSSYSLWLFLYNQKIAHILSAKYALGLISIRNSSGG